ncbi:unnamed protein product [Paramecium primaurelia]|uniref:Transmembrane protein n=1 Tax=Paramecium primaurelia TaxID=5886 RepID=A0A8S1KW76_PARPR|nr:unnamed protein product [Paramecium primaurelia]
MLKFQKRSRNEIKGCFLNLVNSLDFFGQPPFFRILKRQKFNTVLGHILTIILMIVCGLYMYYQIQDLLNHGTPNIIISETQPISMPAFTLDPKNFTFVISITDTSLLSLSTFKKHFDVVLTACNRTRFFNETKQAQDVSLQCRNVPLESCNLDKHFPMDYQKQFFSKFLLKNLFCINSTVSEENPPQIQGYSNADTFQFLQVLMMPCRNSSTYNGCSPPEEIQTALKAGYYAIYLGDTLLKLDNPGRPYEEIITVQFSSFSSSQSKQIQSNFKMIETKTDVGLIRSDIKTELALLQSTQKDFQSSYNQVSYIENLIFMEQRVGNYKRSYIKLQNILGNVGGLWQLVALTISTLVSPVVATLMNLQMANRIFNFENNLNNNESPSVSRSINNLNEHQNQNDFIKEDKNKLGNSQKKSKKNLNQVENRLELKKYLKQKKKQLEIGIFDLFCMNLGIKKSFQQQIKYSIEKIFNKLDVVNILNKMQEIDKLKYVLLNKEQLELFNYIPKPLIPSDMFSKDFEQKLNVLEEKLEFQFILQEEKSDLFKIESAFYAYMKLHQKKKLSETDKNILDLVGEDMISIFEKINKNQDEFLIQSNRNIHSNLNLLEQHQIEILSPISSKGDNVQFNQNDNDMDCNSYQNDDHDEQAAQIPPKIPYKS